MDPFITYRRLIMKYTVEYVFKKDDVTYDNDKSPMYATFDTIDQAISFINNMKKVFSNSIEWMYIHFDYM